MIPDTGSRVPLHTDPQINQRIRQQTRRNAAFAAAGGRAAIARRLAELDAEWDIERLLEANAASVVLATSLLGLTVNRKFLLLPPVVGGFLLQHAIQGWCPPVPLFRRLGFRTADEIAEERYALKALRGDFVEVEASVDEPATLVESALAAARR